jgi:hypothetical protein
LDDGGAIVTHSIFHAKFATSAAAISPTGIRVFGRPAKADEKDSRQQNGGESQ